MSRPCSSARGPKPPIAPKPRLLHEPEEKSCLNTRNSLHQCSNGGQIFSEEELDQDNEPGGLLGESTEVAPEPYFNCNNNGNEEEENEQEFKDKITATICTEVANSDGMQKIFDIECNPELTDVVETSDIECMLDIEPDSCGAGEALADTDGLSEFDIACDNEIADQYPCAPQHKNDPVDLGMNEDSPPQETDTAQEQNEGHWYADKSHTCECFHQQVHFPQSLESVDSFADASSLYKDCQQNLNRLSCTLCKPSENLDDQQVISCVGDGELQNITDSSDLLQHAEETGDFFKFYPVSDAECTTEVVNDVDTEAQNEFSSNSCMGGQSIGFEGQVAVKSSTSPKPFCVLSDKVDDDISEAHPKEVVFNENLGFENPKTEQSCIMDEKHTGANYGDIDNDSLCQDTEDLHQLECVSSEDYVEIGEEDDPDKIGTPQKSIVKDSKCKSKCADASFQPLNSKPCFRLCSITMPVDMDMSTTSELTDTLVFTDSADVFGNDIDIEGHIVPFLEETDTDQDNISDEHVYEEAGLDSEGENFLSMDRKSIVTRSRSLSGKVPGYVPETVPEETGTEYQTNEYCTVALEKNSQSEGKQLEINQILPSSKSRHFFFYPRSFSVEGGDTTMSLYEENDCSVGEDRIKRNEDNRSLPCFAGSSGSFSQRSHLPSSGMSTPTSVVDIPPPFELAYITKKPITKSSPSLLLENDSFDKQKKKKSSFKRFFTLKFRRKRENKMHLDVNVSSSRSSSESSHHGPVRVLEIDRRSLGSSPQPILRSGKPQRASDSPTTFLFYKDSKRKSPPKPFSNRCVSRVESFEDRSRPPFMPLPLTKPRSISFPNADMSDYENIPAISSDYENIQIPSRRPTRGPMFAEFHDDPSRTLSSANENDGYVDMSSFVGFESKAQTPQLEPERVHTQPETMVPVSVGLPGKPEIEDDQGRTSEEEDGGAEYTQDKQTDGRSRAFYIAKDLVDSEKVHIKGLKLLQEDFRIAVAGSVGEDGEPAVPEDSFNEIVGKLPEVYQLHCCLLSELEYRVKHWEESQRIADVFLAQRAELTVFTDYISQYDRSMALLDESCQRSPTFAAIVKQFGGLVSGNVTVKHQLLQVIIRMLQYRMLLTDYLNNLSPDSTEYEDTQAALLIISEVADQANDNLKQGENLLRLVHIEYSVGGQSDLIQPGRKFVKEGTLMKVSRKSRQPRHLFLMNDVLLYTFPQQDGKYRLKNTLHLTGMKISKPTLENVQYALRIEVNEVSITLSTSSSGEHDDWFHTLSRTVDDHSRGLGASGISVGEVRDKLWMSLGEKAPTLVPVSHVMMCMNCTSDFSLTLRRHHCHACGKIVCRGCSRNKYPLKYLKDRMAKVCDHCYTELKKQGGDVAEVSPEASPRTKRVSRPLSAVFQNIHPPSLWKQRKTTATLNQIPMEAEGSTTSGTLHRCKRSKKNWKRLWFLVKDKDKIASESLPLLGFTVKLPEGPAGEDANNAFPLYQKKSLYCTFKAEDNSSAQRWINAIEEATVL
ncbi:FYVE, RhoGEF and PH domain-containing protein 5-like isoform X2 [Scleropages formosus]|uniref:FYVE, RhoGEF and PH domain containing 5 n=2 Tax=Scleropages formosus TaxID=113540 RepID=A0A8C9V6W1_SCLFO|nr:FYVE, RhoGEF and PH domain-containing protein 5-like isoform X2 [Scleropages formosus]XP_018612210.1 FYVE, RhoGEF and PH domain-containing protein 5-like isoform X2 [Scleropages formosus]